MVLAPGGLVEGVCTRETVRGVGVVVGVAEEVIVVVVVVVGMEAVVMVAAVVVGGAAGVAVVS
jgi:hypothetical protein